MSPSGNDGATERTLFFIVLPLLVIMTTIGMNTSMGERHQFHPSSAMSNYDMDTEGALIARWTIWHAFFIGTALGKSRFLPSSRSNVWPLLNVVLGVLVLYTSYNRTMFSPSPIQRLACYQNKLAFCYSGGWLGNGTHFDGTQTWSTGWVVARRWAHWSAGALFLTFLYVEMVVVWWPVQSDHRGTDAIIDRCSPALVNMVSFLFCLVFFITISFVACLDIYDDLPKEGTSLYACVQWFIAIWTYIVTWVKTARIQISVPQQERQLTELEGKEGGAQLGLDAKHRDEVAAEGVPTHAVNDTDGGMVEVTIREPTRQNVIGEANAAGATHNAEAVAAVENPGPANRRVTSKVGNMSHHIKIRPWWETAAESRERGNSAL